MAVIALERQAHVSISAPLRQAMRQLVGGVSVLTVGQAPHRTGCTVTSVVSLSVDPPRILVCINRQASAFDAVMRCRAFAVNVLATHHRQLAERFGGRGEAAGEGRFAGACWHKMETGSSILCDALAAVDCEVEEVIERGSHAIVIGNVVAARGGDLGDALVYWRGRYDHQCLQQNQPSNSEWGAIL